MNSQRREVTAKTPMVWGDTRKPGQWSKIFRQASSWKREAGNRSTRAVTGITFSTSKRAKSFWCGRTEHKWHECWKHVSAGATLGAQAGRETRAADLSSSGREVAGTRKRPGNVTLSGTEDVEARRQRNEEVSRLVVVIERLSDSFERHGNILREERRESAGAAKENMQSLKRPLRGGRFTVWHEGFTSTCMNLLWIVHACFDFCLRWYGPSRGGSREIIHFSQSTRGFCRVSVELQSQTHESKQSTLCLIT